jgi:hypothetical protein
MKARNRFFLWFYTKRDLITENQQLWQLFGSQQHAIRRLTLALQEYDASRSWGRAIQKFHGA